MKLLLILNIQETSCFLDLHIGKITYLKNNSKSDKKYVRMHNYTVSCQVSRVFLKQKNIGRKNFVELNQITDKESSFLL